MVEKKTKNKKTVKARVTKARAVKKKQVEEKKDIPIERMKVWVNPEIVSSSYTHVSNASDGVRYCLYRDDRENYVPEDPIGEFDAEWITGWCFGDLLSRLNRDSNDKGEEERFNRLYYKMELVPACIELTEEEKIRYIELAVKHKLLPSYVDPVETVKSSVMVIQLEGLVQAQLYMYLCIFRFLREDPGVVRSIVHLVTEHGMDFYAAYVVACGVALNYDLHNFTRVTRAYGSDKELVNKMKNIPLSTVVSVRKFANEPKAFDKVGVYDTVERFKGYSKIEGVFKTPHMVSVQDLLDPIVVEAMDIDDESAFNDRIAEYFKMKESFVYIEKEVGKGE